MQVETIQNVMINENYSSWKGLALRTKSNEEIHMATNDKPFYTLVA